MNYITLIFLIISIKLVAQETFQTEMNQLLQHFPPRTEVAIAVINQDKVQFYGYLKDDDTIQAISNEHHVFEIGSLSKVFTSTLLAISSEKKQIKLNAPIQNFFDFKLKIKDKINLIQLANHTAGLGRLPSNILFTATDINNIYKNYKPSDLEYFLKNEMRLYEKPGTNYDYSNTGAGLLGYILGKAHQSDYSTILQEQITIPLNMKNTYLNYQQVDSNLVVALNSSGELTNYWEMDVLQGAGGIYSTVNDLSKFMIAHLDTLNSAYQKTHISTFTISSTMKIGLGWHILSFDDSSKEILWHNGATGSFTSSMALDVANQKGIVILSNCPFTNNETQYLDEFVINFIKK